MKIHIEEMLNNDIDTVNMKWKTDAEYLEGQYKLLLFKSSQKRN